MPGIDAFSETWSLPYPVKFVEQRFADNDPNLPSRHASKTGNVAIPASSARIQMFVSTTIVCMRG